MADISGGALTYAVSAVADSSGSASVLIQNPTAPPLAWEKINVVMDVAGSASCALVVDGITVDQAGGPQPQLGPAVFTGSQQARVLVTGAQPNSQIVAHVNGAWDDSLGNLDGISTLSGGTISAAQLVGTPFLENAAQAIAPSQTFTSPIYPMLGYSAVFVQTIVTLGALTAMPTVALQWLDNSSPPVQLFQSNWQAQKIIDIVAAWGQNARLVVTNNDAAHTCNIALTLVPVADSPPRKADALTYKQTALNELVGIHNQAVTVGTSATASTAAGLGYSGPATAYLSVGDYVAGGSDYPDFAFKAQYAPAWNGSSPIGTVKTLFDFPRFAPNLAIPVDLIDQPILLTFTNNSPHDVTDLECGIVAAYR